MPLAMRGAGPKYAPAFSIVNPQRGHDGESSQIGLWQKGHSMDSGGATSRLFAGDHASRANIGGLDFLVDRPGDVP
jgi:hypothetical protein